MKRTLNILRHFRLIVIITIIEGHFVRQKDLTETIFTVDKLVVLAYVSYVMNKYFKPGTLPPGAIIINSTSCLIVLLFSLSNSVLFLYIFYFLEVDKVFPILNLKTVLQYNTN